MNIRSLKNKIKSIGNVGQITRAMQLVSAVKMKKSQDRANQGKPYQEALQATIKKIIFSGQQIEHPLTLEKKDLSLPKLAIVISSNKGLCGVFNFNLFKFLDAELGGNLKNYQFVVMGVKAQQFLFHYGANIVADFSNKLPFEDNVNAIYDLIIDAFKNDQVSEVSLYYNSFISSLVYQPTKKILLPLDIANFTSEEEKIKPEDYQVEPDAFKVLSGLFNFYIESTIREAIRESEASEHSARMIAMKNATDNTTDLVSRLSLLNNSLRQARITNELLDMNTAKLAVS
jgi:F-type H+-transporting ATPase subunit gamma